MAQKSSALEPNFEANEFPDWLKRELQCPSCNRVMTDDSIHLCKRNQAHAMCNKCRIDHKSCAVCQGEMLWKSNLMVEKIIHNIPKDKDWSSQLVASGIPAWMKRALECPVCLETIMDPPIFVCENSQGHSVCSTCHDTIQKYNKTCPVCPSRLSKRRNVAMERMVEGIPNKIKCRFDGCDVQRSNEVAVKKHEEHCEHRYISCEAEGCYDRKIGLRKFAEHVIKEHRDGRKTFNNRQFSRRYTIAMTAQVEYKSQDVLFFTDGHGPQTFLLNCCSCFGYKSGSMLVWIAYIGPKESASNYKYTLQLEDAARNIYLTEDTRYCIPCDLSHLDVMIRWCAVVLDNDSIKRATKDRNILSFALTIFKV